MKIFTFLFMVLAFYPLFAANCPLKDGDIIFIKSQSSQSKLLNLVTGSPWTHVGMLFKNNNKWDVIEAVQPVKWTSLYSFVRRSHQLHFEVKRVNFDFSSAQVKLVREFSEKLLNKNYDLIFAWDNERQYCSELVWKAYQFATSKNLGELQQIKDLKFDHPMVIAEAKKRFNNYGLEFNLEQWKNSQVITPVQMLDSPNLSKVTDQKKILELESCLK